MTRSMFERNSLGSLGPLYEAYSLLMEVAILRGKTYALAGNLRGLMEHTTKGHFT